MSESPMDAAPPGDQAGAPEEGAKPPRDGADAGDFLELKIEPMRVLLTIRKEAAALGFPLTREAVSTRLAGQKLACETDWTAVDRMIAGRQYERAQLIASGIPAKPSRDAFILEKFKIDADVKPVLDQAGKADYKNVDNIHHVKKGDVLATKTPAVQGTEGRDVFGKTIPVAQAKDIQFNVGVNTAVSDDGLRLEATVGGYAYHQAGAICVGVTYVLDGDVDFKTGNLHYQGAIEVKGNVTDGFIVEAEGDVTVEGTVEGAQVISHGGRVTIKSGVFGHGKGLIAGKSIGIVGAQDVKLQCEGDLEVEKGLRNCQVTAHGVKADRAGCSVVGGEIKVFGGASIGVLGGEGCHTTIRILDKESEAAKARLKQVEALWDSAEKKLIPIETKLKGMKAMLTRCESGMSERSKAEVKAVAEVYMGLKKAEKSLDDEKAALKAMLSERLSHGGTFAVTEKIIWGGVLEICGHVRELQEEDARKEWTLTQMGLVSRSLIPETTKPDPGTPPKGPAPLS